MHKHNWCPGTCWGQTGHRAATELLRLTCLGAFPKCCCPTAASFPVRAVALLCNQTQKHHPQSLGAASVLTVSLTLHRTYRIKQKGRKHFKTAVGTCVDTISVIGHTHLQLSCPIKVYSSSFQRLLISSLNLSVLICMLLF